MCSGDNDESIPNLEEPNQGDTAADGDDDCPDISELELGQADDEVCFLCLIPVCPCVNVCPIPGDHPDVHG